MITKEEKRLRRIEDNILTLQLAFLAWGASCLWFGYKLYQDLDVLANAILVLKGAK